jgi:ribonuclease P protein component
MASTPSARLRFPRAARIKRGVDFARLRGEGQRVTLGCLIANWRRLHPGAVSRLGVITPRRIGAAVVRNRARRLLRESFRLNRARLAEPIDLVLVARSSIVSKDFFEVETDFLTSLRKAGLLREIKQ